MKLDALVAPLRADVVSGAAVIGRTASVVVRRAVSRVPAETPGEFRDMLVALCIRILEAQPAMAPLVTLTSQVLHAFEPTDSLESAMEKVDRAAAAFGDDLDGAARIVARQTGSLLPAGSRVLTLSASSTVRRALLLHGVEKALHVACLEARPMSEGRHFAAQLAKAGIPVTYAVDAAAGSLVREADMVLLGADSVGDRGIANKIGSSLLTCSAQRLGRPVYLLVDRSKLLPPGFRQVVEDDRPEDEVWQAPAGVKVWNRYFEIVPLDAVTEIVTEEGVMSPSQLQQARTRIPVPPELRRWAESLTP